MDGWVGGLVMGWVVNDAGLTMTTVTDETHHEVGGMSRQMCQSVWSHINIRHYLLTISSSPHHLNIKHKTLQHRPLQCQRVVGES